MIHPNEIRYDLDHASDGEAGLAKIEQKDYAMVILDLMLPKLGGLEA